MIDAGHCYKRVSGRGCSVKGRFLGQEGEKYFASFSQVKHKGMVYSRFHESSFCKIVSLFHCGVGEEGFS